MLPAGHPKKIRKNTVTLQGINISHLGKFGNSSSKVPFWEDMLVPWRVFHQGTLHRGPGDEFAIHLTGDHLQT